MRGRDGKELYYATSGNTVWALPLKEVVGALQFGVPQTLVTNWSPPDPFFQASPDGKKILLYRVSQQVGDALTVVCNFASEIGAQVKSLKRKHAAVTPASSRLA